MLSNSIYQPQVVAALSQFSSLLSSARTGSSSGTYRRINTQRTNRKTKQIASQAAKQTDEVKKATKEFEIDINDVVALPSQINIQELSPHMSLIHKGCHVSHVSTDTFFENKSGLSEKFVNSDVHQEVQRILRTEPFRKLLKTCTNNLYYQQTRGFKTHRLKTVGMGGQKSESELNKFVNILFQDKSGQKPVEGEKFKAMHQKHSGDHATQQELKISFADGYLARDPTHKKHYFDNVIQGLLKSAVYLFCLYVILKLVASNLMGRGSGVGGLSILKQEPFEIAPEDVHVTFDDVKGIDTAKDELMEVVDFLKDPDKYTVLGAKLPKGVLLVGPPGIGKTLLARAVAGEAGVPFFQCSGSEFDEMFVGLGAKRIRDLFRQAKEKGTCVIFIDEIDSVGAKRTSSELHPYANQTINQLLAEMDGFAQNENIIVLGATNRIDHLDKALRRKGRFDVEVRVFPPDLKGRRDILNLYLGKVKADKNIKVEDIAKGTTGFNGADIQDLVNQAALKAAMEGEDMVYEKHLYWARDKVLMGPENKNKIPDENTNWNTAYHEAGHTIVAYFTKEATALHQVTIRARGVSLGHTSFIPETEEYNQTKAKLSAEMDVAMGGRVAEEIIFGSDHVTTGASSDFQSASRIATAMVTKLGMSDKIGVRVFDIQQQDGGLGFIMVNQYSEAVTKEIDSEIKRLLQESYDRAKKILTNHSEQHKELAKMLMKYETLNKEEIKLVMDGKPLNKKVFS
ncbi:ATP-dependent zinc metalloprotease YME1L1-like [Mytilus trossulus]|uniref:ATP-dependent zinc metalloprotease YME1L1-like n=1 Tax=Mytilus trossulus TaxID=6551 RepID=UPI0030069F9C